MKFFKPIHKRTRHEWPVIDEETKLTWENDPMTSDSFFYQEVQNEQVEEIQTIATPKAPKEAKPINDEKIS